MDLYTFMVEKFLIIDTRAKHHDSLWLGYSASVDGDLVAQRSFKMAILTTAITVLLATTRPTRALLVSLAS